MTTTKQVDFPLLAVDESARKIVAQGGFIFQKWTCGGCGARCMANDPNVLTIKCHHEECGFVTDIIQTGCNFAAAMPASKGARDAQSKPTS